MNELVWLGVGIDAEENSSTQTNEFNHRENAGRAVLRNVGTLTAARRKIRHHLINSRREYLKMRVKTRSEDTH